MPLQLSPVMSMLPVPSARIMPNTSWFYCRVVWIKKVVLPSEKGNTSVAMGAVPKDSPREPAPNARSILKLAEVLVVVQSLMAMIEEAVVGRPRRLTQGLTEEHMDEIVNPDRERQTE